MMKILGCRIHWYLGWANSPDVYLWLDETPKWDDLIHTTHFTSPRQVIWLAEKDNFVSYYVDITTKEHNVESKQDEGLGGRHVEINTSRYGKHTLKGPWISNPMFANVNHPVAKARNIIDVAYTTEKEVWDRGYTYIAGHVVRPWLDKFLHETFGVQFTRVDKNNYTTIALSRPECLGITETQAQSIRNSNRYSWLWTAENGAENEWLKGQDLLDKFKPSEVKSVDTINPTVHNPNRS